MRTPYKDGFIDARLSKPETAVMRKTLELVQTLSKMQPIRKPLSEAAQTATDALTTVLKIAACDNEEEHA